MVLYSTKSNNTRACIFTFCGIFFSLMGGTVRKVEQREMGYIGRG